LTKIKVLIPPRPNLMRRAGERAMPIESILVVSVVVLAFTLFGAALAWVDFTTSRADGWRRTPAE
jgi:hypothetical protein